MKFKWWYITFTLPVISTYVFSYLVHIGINSHWWVPVTAIWSAVGLAWGLALIAYLWQEDK